MPRGQYDRSKSKAQRAAEKNADAPKSTVKKARAPYGSKKAAKVAASSTFTGYNKESTAGGTESYSLENLASLRACFASPVNTNIISKIDTLIAAKLDVLLSEIASSKNGADAPKKTLQAPAPVQAAAPVQAVFNPSVPPNGQA